MQIELMLRCGAICIKPSALFVIWAGRTQKVAYSFAVLTLTPRHNVGETILHLLLFNRIGEKGNK